MQPVYVKKRAECTEILCIEVSRTDLGFSSRGTPSECSCTSPQLYSSAGLVETPGSSEDQWYKPRLQITSVER